jgi:hypothetical protein
MTSDTIIIDGIECPIDTDIEKWLRQYVKPGENYHPPEGWEDRLAADQLKAGRFFEESRDAEMAELARTAHVRYR